MSLSSLSSSFDFVKNRESPCFPPRFSNCQRVSLQLAGFLTPTMTFWSAGFKLTFLAVRGQKQIFTNKFQRSSIRLLCPRYGGWVEGLESNNSVVAAKENSAVYFNNKVSWRLPILWSTILTFIFTIRDFTRWWRISTLQITQD